MFLRSARGDTIVTAENLRSFLEKFGNNLLANPPTYCYKYVYIILDSQSCCLALSVRMKYIFSLQLWLLPAFTEWSFREMRTNRGKNLKCSFLIMRHVGTFGTPEMVCTYWVNYLMRLKLNPLVWLYFVAWGCCVARGCCVGSLIGGLDRVWWSFSSKYIYFREK